MWKDIAGYEGQYQVSSDGRVRSLDRYVLNTLGVKRYLRGSEMKLSNGGHGYLVVNLRKHSIGAVRPVHRLVAEAFLPNPQNLPTVNHIDGVKTNNDVSNLEWVTYGENNVHALVHNLRKPRGNPILQFTLDGEFVAEFVSTHDACRKTGISVGGISHCLNHRTCSSGGYVWKKKSEGATTIPQGSTQEISTCGSAPHPDMDDDIVCPARNCDLSR